MHGLEERIGTISWVNAEFCAGIRKPGTKEVSLAGPDPLGAYLCGSGFARLEVWF